MASAGTLAWECKEGVPGLARERATKVRTQVEVGLDPVAERRKEAGIPTFKEAAALVFAEHKASWRNQKHRAQWLSTLETYAFPMLGDLSVAVIDGHHVRDAVISIWLEKPETARRVRQRINTVIDWAIGKGYRTTPLPIAAMNKSMPKVKAKGCIIRPCPMPMFRRSLPNSMSGIRWDGLLLRR
nr:hypothetical protein [Acidocella sp. C78]